MPNRVKLMIVGDLGCGKTCLIRRYCEGAFESRYIPTVCVDYGVRALQLSVGTQVRANFYDSSGSPSYSLARCEFYREADGLMLAFDVRDGDSVGRLDAWLAEARRYGLREDIPIVLCGTKTDEPSLRAVSRAAAEKWVGGHPGTSYHETSAHSGEGVKEAIEALLLTALVESSSSTK